MFRRASYATTVLGMSLALVAGSPFWGSVRPITASGSQSAPETPLSASLDLIRRQKYDDAITRLEQILETDSANGEALTLLGTANLYRDLDFTKAQKEFMAAYKAGGGATFFVTHSHEGFAGEDVVNYCRGWLHLRKSGVEFAAIDSPHSFKISFAELEE